MNFDFADILLKVVEHKASDLHITSGAPPTVRVRGSLVPLEGMPNLTPTDTREIVYAILSSSQRQSLETDWQLDFAYSVPGVGRFRVNTFFQRGTLGAAFRIIPSETVPIEKLGLPPVVREFARKPRGIVLVTGPTGSGKSTTLASLINEINETRDEHIMTIEDPIEFLHKHKRCIVNQRELGADAQSFAAALKAALRQDPDVILVGPADATSRCVAAEVLVPTPGVRNLIREGKTHQIYSLIQTGGQHGMQTMDASLAGLVREQRITMAVAETRSSEPAEMRKLVHAPAAAGAM